MKVYINTERKFVSTRMAKEEIISRSHFNKSERMMIEQFYSSGVKYRKFVYEDNHLLYTVSSNKENKTYVNEIDQFQYENARKLVNQDDIILKERTVGKNKDFKFAVDVFLQPCQFTMLEVEKNNTDIKEFIPYKTLIEVTDIQHFSNKNIKKGSLITYVIIDGGDCAGKTTVIKRLLSKGIIIQDRSVDKICPFMFSHISEEDRTNGLRDNLIGALKDKIVIFLVNTDENEVNKRLKHRQAMEGLSDFDEDALYYNKMYEETYKNLSEVQNLHIVISNGKSEIEVENEIENIVKGGV